MFDDLYDSEEEKRSSERYHEEIYFTQFFKSVLDTILKQFNISQSELSQSLDSMTKIFEYSSRDRFSEIDYNSIKNLCSYFHRFGPISAGLTRHRVVEAVNECPEFKSYLQNLNGFKNSVVSIGGGSGCDIIGFSSGVHGIIDCEKLDLTVVDNVEGWKIFFEHMIDVARKGLFKNDLYSPYVFKFQDMFRKMDVHESFVWQDASLYDEVSEAYMRALKMADVVIMKSLLSVLPKSSAFNVATNISLAMKEGSMLLFMDEKEFDFCQLGLEKVYSSVGQSTKDNIYHFQEYANESCGRKSAPFTNETLTLYKKINPDL